MKNSSISVRNIVAIGIGTAIFTVLARFSSIPTGFPNVNFEVAYAFLALMAIIFGPFSGFLIGFLGHLLKDMLFYGNPWFSWVLASSMFGLIVGFGLKFIDLNNFKLKEVIKFVFLQIIANISSWLIVAPILDILIYVEPLNKVFIQGVSASIFNTLTTSVIGTILIFLYSKSRVKKGSLSKES